MWTGWRLWWPAAVVVAAILLLAVVEAPQAGSRSVTDSTDRGYQAAFEWLAEQGSAQMWEGALGDATAGTTLVLVWPLEKPLDPVADATTLLRHATAGGRVVLLLDGASPVEPPRELLDGAMGVSVVSEEPVPPYRWSAWKAWEEDRRTAKTEDGTIRVARPHWTLDCRRGTPIATRSDGRHLACRVPRGRGEVVVIADATVWQNDHLGRNQNLELLTAVLGGQPVLFDELHHSGGALGATTPTHVPALLFLHLGLLWLLAVLALARRFGDPLPTPALPRPSMARALHALATLHRGSGHAHDAALRIHAVLNARAARRGLPPLPEPDVESDTQLVVYTQQVGAAQRAARL
jgi:hypothetical protein